MAREGPQADAVMLCSAVNHKELVVYTCSCNTPEVSEMQQVHSRGMASQKPRSQARRVPAAASKVVEMVVLRQLLLMNS